MPLKWTVGEVFEALGVQDTSSVFGGEHQFECISTDSRMAGPGVLFVPLIGERFDAHDFVADVLARGGASLWSRPGEAPSGVLRVPDTLEALQQLGRYHLKKRIRCKVAAITGSTGKTTTKDLLAVLLGTRYSVLKTQGNYNNDVGVPLTLLALEPEHEVAVVEFGMRGPGQIRRLARLVEPDVAVITNIGISHIELLGSQENIARAKAEIYEGVQELACVPKDSPFYEILKQPRERTFSCRGDADVYPLRTENLGLDGWKLAISTHPGLEIHLPLPGPHHLEDFMAAWSVATVIGLDPEKVNEALKGAQLSQLRLEVHRLGRGITLLNDSYNAAPDSMRGALQVLGYATGRKVAVLGDMLELGPVEEEAHRQVGEWARQAGCELMAVGPRSRAMGAVLWVETVEEAAEALRGMLRPGDTVLLKASRGMGLDRLAPVVREVAEDV